MLELALFSQSFKALYIKYIFLYKFCRCQNNNAFLLFNFICYFDGYIIVMSDASKRFWCCIFSQIAQGVCLTRSKFLCLSHEIII